MEKIYCTENEHSTLWEGNVCEININEFLCKTYNHIFQLGIIYNKSFNPGGGNLSTKNHPHILYGPVLIKGGNFNSFFKRLTQIDSKLEANDYCVNDVYLSEADFLYFEKMILVDLQSQINLYTYLKYTPKRNSFNLYLEQGALRECTPLHG